MSSDRMPNVLMLGTGEYTTGFTGEGASKSDKSTGGFKQAPNPEIKSAASLEEGSAAPNLVRL